MENKRFLTYTALAACLICVIAVAFNVFTDMELLGRIMAAILGVVITATITQVLLQGQTQKEGTLKRDSKIFEEKLKIYQNFLNTLYKAVEDGELTEKEKMELQFQTSLVAMHCDPKHIKNLSSAVKGVVENTCPNKGDKPTNQTALLESLFDVVEVFRQDLYPDEFKQFDKEDREDAIKEFAEAYREAKEGEELPQQHLIVDLNLLSDAQKQISRMAASNKTEPSDDNGQKADDVATGEPSDLWKSALKRWENAGWAVNPDPVSEVCPLLLKRTDGNPGEINMGFYDGHYYLQSKYENDTYFSQCLKWENGGRRSRGAWWEYPPLALDIQQGEFLQSFNSSPKLQEYIMNKVEYLQSVIMKNDLTTRWMKAVGKPKDWTLFTWYWSTLACEYQNEAEGKVYIDAIPVEGKKAAVIKLGNRADNAEQLKQILIRIGQADKAKEIRDGECAIELEMIPSQEPEEVGKRIKHWVGLVSNEESFAK